MVQLMYPMRDDPRYNCLCGIHVQTGALIIALLGAVFFALLALAVPFPLTIFYVLLMAIHLSILIGHKQRVAAWYIPFLIYQFIYNFFLTLLYVLLILVIFATGAVQISRSDSDFVRDMKEIIDHLSHAAHIPVTHFVEAGVVLLLLIFGFIVALNYWFYSIVASAQRYVKEEQTWEAQNMASLATGLTTSVIWQA